MTARKEPKKVKRLPEAYWERPLEGQLALPLEIPERPPEGEAPERPEPER